MNHHHRDLRRVARSAECSTAGETATPPKVIERLAIEVYRQGRGIYFSAADLARMPWPTRDVIEGEARRICERGNGR